MTGCDVWGHQERQRRWRRRSFLGEEAGYLLIVAVNFVSDLTAVHVGSRLASSPARLRSEYIRADSPFRRLAPSGAATNGG